MGCATLGGQSFSADTKVQLADGGTKDISDLKPGDKVKSTDTSTGKTNDSTTSAVLVNHDTDLYDLTVHTANGDQVIHTTAHHLFFDRTTQSWVEAAKLPKGDQLATDSDPGHDPYDGTTATAEGGTTPADSSGDMWDLTVPGDHDFYVMAGDTPVLVHNCIDYGSINQYGQRSGVRARLDSSNLGGRTRPRPTEPIPSYVPGQDNRTHLLGALIGGSNKRPENFVAMFREANNPEMLRYEYQIRDALKAGQVVDFRATPIYRGNDSRPLGITITAKGSGPNPLNIDVTVLNRRY